MLSPNRNAGRSTGRDTGSPIAFSGSVPTAPLRKNTAPARRTVAISGRFALLCALAGAPAAVAAALDQKAPEAGLSELDREGARRLFNYDFGEADRVYRRMSEQFPEHAAGPYNRAAVIWTRLAQQSGGMRGSSHTGDRYWTQTRKPEATAEDEERFRGYIAEALARAGRALERDPGDHEALYYRGATEALESGWQVIVRRSYLRGFLSIRRAVGRHRRILEEDPDFADARAVPGAYEYGAATLPRALRVIARLFGARGDKTRGIAGVERTAREGIRARWGALWTLVVLLQREERLEEALAAVRQLKREFPKNPDYALEEAGILIARRDFPAARAAVRGFLGRRDSGFGNYHLAADGLAELRLGESFLFEKEWVSAEAAFERGLSASPVSEIEALLHFRRGNARDGMGRRSEGLRDYLRVRQIGSDEVLGEWAGQLLGTPWPEGAPEGAAPQ